MNVSTIINNEKYQLKLEKYIDYPIYKVKNELKYYNNPKNHDLIGHAYEIMFQLFYLKENERTDIFVLKCFKDFYKLGVLSKRISSEYKRKLNKIIKLYTNIEKRIKNYLTNKKYKLDNRILKDILYLSQLVRIRDLEDIFKLKKIKKKDIRDLKILKESLFEYNDLIKKDILFNVSLRNNDLNISGELDLVLSNTIIDIKTVTENKITKKFINQLVLYYLLTKNKNIKKVGILFSRYGCLKLFHIRDIISEKNERKLVKFFDKEPL